MWMIDTPNRFAPRSEMLDFLKECETIKGHDPLGQVQRAMAEVEEYLKQPDPRIEAEWRAKNPCTIDWPPPWARKRVMRAFLRKMAAHPDPDHPDVKWVVGRVEGYLALAEKEPRHRRPADKARIEEALKVTPREEIMDGLPKPALTQH
jgi:hypothetical protein